MIAKEIEEKGKCEQEKANKMLNHENLGTRQKNSNVQKFDFFGD